MKLKHPVLIVLGLTSSALLLPLAARAQSPDAAPTATPSVSTPDAAATPGKHHGNREAAKERWAALTPDEQARVKAAHEKAMQDPAVKAAEAEKKTDHKAYAKAVHEATLRADPTVGPLLEKLHPHGGHAQTS
jgi:hypothetical protein